LPEEACGFLVGTGKRVVRFIPAPNALGSATAFSIDPDFLFRMHRDLRSRNERVIAICHSHPTVFPVPSARDVALAQDPGPDHVIVSLAGDRADVRAFRIRDGNVARIPLREI